MPVKKVSSRSYRAKPRRRFRKRIYRRKTAMIRSPNAAGVHWFKRTLNSHGDVGFQTDGNYFIKGNYDYITNGAVATAGTIYYGTFTYIFSIQNLPNVSEFTNLFDAYQIRKVVVKIRSYPNSSNSSSNNGTPGVYGDMSPMLHYAIDHDSAATPTASEVGIQDLQQYVSYKNRRLIGDKPIAIVIKPRTASSVYKGAFTGYSENKRNTWIDCTNNDVQYYGLRGVVEFVSPGSVQVYVPVRIETTYYLKFKGPR